MPRGRDFDPAEHPRWPRETPQGRGGEFRDRDAGIPGDLFGGEHGLTPGSHEAWARIAAGRIVPTDRVTEARPWASQIALAYPGSSGAGRIQIQHPETGDWHNVTMVEPRANGEAVRFRTDGGDFVVPSAQEVGLRDRGQQPQYHGLDVTTREGYFAQLLVLGDRERQANRDSALEDAELDIALSAAIHSRPSHGNDPNAGNHEFEVLRHVLTSHYPRSSPEIPQRPDSVFLRSQGPTAGAGGEHEPGESVYPAVALSEMVRSDQQMQMHNRAGGWSNVRSSWSERVAGGSEIVFQLEDDDEPIYMGPEDAVAARFSPDSAVNWAGYDSNHGAMVAVRAGQQIGMNERLGSVDQDLVRAREELQTALNREEPARATQAAFALRRMLERGYPEYHRGTLPYPPPGYEITDATLITTEPELEGGRVGFAHQISDRIRAGESLQVQDGDHWSNIQDAYTSANGSVIFEREGLIGTDNRITHPVGGMVTYRTTPASAGHWSDTIVGAPESLWAASLGNTGTRYRVQDDSMGVMEVDHIERVDGNTFRFHYANGSYMTRSQGTRIDYQLLPDAPNPTEATGTASSRSDRQFGEYDNSSGTPDPSTLRQIPDELDFNDGVYAQASELLGRLEQQGDRDSVNYQRLFDLMTTYRDATGNYDDYTSIENAVDDLAGELLDYDIALPQGGSGDLAEEIGGHLRGLTRGSAQDARDEFHNGSDIEILSSNGTWDRVTEANEYEDEIGFVLQGGAFSYVLDIASDETVRWRYADSRPVSLGQVRQSIETRTVDEPEPGQLPYGASGLGEVLERADSERAYLGPRGSEAVGQRIRQMLELDDRDGSGMRIRVGHITPNYGTAMVDGSIEDENGNELGNWRTFFQVDYDGNSFVDQSYMALPPSAQGGGLAARWAAQLQQAYRENKIKYVTVHANIDVGGYAWAKAGFDFYDPNDGRYMATDLAGQVRDGLLRRNNGRDRVEVGQLSEATKQEVQALAARAAAGEHITPLEIALVGWGQREIDGFETRERGGRQIETWLGKQFLLGSDWHGKAML